MGGWAWLWPALVLTGLLLIGYVVVRLVLAGLAPPTGSPTASPRASGARRILDERYARGEVDDEEYQRRRDALS